MTKLSWRDLRKDKPDYGQVVLVKWPFDGVTPMLLAARYSPYRSSTTGRLVPVFICIDSNLAIGAHEWYPIPTIYDEVA